jgi:hypothetical protein
MIQAIMLIALGFLMASLIGVLLAPSLWSRAYRLSKKRLESTLPLTLAEIEAAQDQLRAAYAVRVRRLESALAGAKQKAANQLVDNSRLQMQIVALKDQMANLDLELAERRNAATVLEQTITKRFPELDREITAVKAQLQERSYEFEDLTGKLARREEELAATQEAAASYQEELERLHQVLEKSAADRSGRRVRRASQWDLEDYRAEYDRLNLELSKLRQQLALFQERDTQQVGVIKGELQKLAESILASAQPKDDLVQLERIEPAVKRVTGQDARRERPAPWLHNVQPPTPRWTARKLDSPSEPASPSRGPASPSEETAPTQAPNDGQGDGGGRPKILQEAVTPNSGVGGVIPAASPGGASVGETSPIPAAEAAHEQPGQGDAHQEGVHVEADGSKAAAGPETGESAPANGARHAPYQNGETEGASLADAINLESLSPDPEDEKIGPHLPTLLERLRGVSEESGEGEKPPSAAQGLAP